MQKAKIWWSQKVLKETISPTPHPKGYKQNPTQPPYPPTHPMHKTQDKH